MKNFALSISFLLLTLFSFAGGCTHHLEKTYSDTELGKMVRLTFAVDLTQPSPYCGALSRCNSFQWYKVKDNNFVIIPGATGRYYDTYEPGIYKLVACGSTEGGVTVVKDEEVSKIDDSPVNVISQFSVYPNPSKDEVINLLVPSSPISSESNSFKIELYNALGNLVLKKQNLIFGIHHMSIGIQGKSAGIYLLKITSGEEVKVLKVMVR